METNFREQSGNGNEIYRQDIKASIDRSVELRALHAALIQGNSPPNLNRDSASPVSRHAPNSSALDYPVFAPVVSIDRVKDNETVLSDYTTEDASSRKGLSLQQGHIRHMDNQYSISGFTLKASPGTDSSESRTTSFGDIEPTSSSNKCKILSNEKTKIKGPSLSWLFPSRLKKKNKNRSSPIRSKPEETSEMLDDFRVLSVEKLKNELIEAKATRDAALNEVKKMKSSFGELNNKMECLENYCEELKKALRQIKNNPPRPVEKLTNFSKSWENSMPVSEEVMVEGFLQIVSEARLSVEQFCKILLKQIEKENDHTLTDDMNSLLRPYKRSLNSKYSKSVLYDLEAFTNESLYREFENCVFRKNGTPMMLDPRQERRAMFERFVTLRNLSSNEVLRKGTKSYSFEFSEFCGEKMSGIIGTLGWTRPWPEHLLQAFFVAAKCAWLLHLLAFSFYPALGILRVDENRPFEARYMEDIFADKESREGHSRVKIMVMPGFYVHDEVVRCKVVCR